jgi:hypothetical protein
MRKHAEDVVVDFLKCLLRSSVKSAAKAVLKQSQMDEFEHGIFAEAKRKIEEATQKIVKAEGTVEVEDLSQNLGKIIDAVKQLSEATPPEDGEEAAAKRNKLMRGRFMNKLIRIKWGLGNERTALTDCQGPGVLLCCAISSVYKEHLCKEEGKTTGEYDMAGLSYWVAENCNLFEFKEELECDFHGTLTLNSPNAFIVRGEAKSSIKYYHKAMQQMDEQARVIEFALAIFFKDDPFEYIFKTYHLFVLEAKTDGQRKSLGKDYNGTVVHIHFLDGKEKMVDYTNCTHQL